MLRDGKTDTMISIDDPARMLKEIKTTLNGTPGTFTLPRGIFAGQNTNNKP
jgi:hypothetical protein